MPSCGHPRRLESPEIREDSRAPPEVPHPTQGRTHRPLPACPVEATLRAATQSAHSTPLARRTVAHPRGANRCRSCPRNRFEPIQIPRYGYPPSHQSRPSSRRSFDTVQLIENLINRGRRNAEVFPLRRTETVAYVGEHGEFTLEVCRGSIAHRLILPNGAGESHCADQRIREAPSALCSILVTGRDFGARATPPTLRW